MTAETDQILHTIKRMVRQALHDMEMDIQRYKNERMERQAQLDAEAEELKAGIAKMQAEIDEAIKKTKHYPSSSIIVALIACFGSIVVALIAAATFSLRNPL